MYKAAGASIAVWSEHLRNNPGSFSTTFASDDWSQQACDGPTPAQVQASVARPRDVTAYATPPAEESWWHRTVGKHVSPAGIAAGRSAANGSHETGGLT